ncbi:rubredoxin [Paraglaciecola arctica]|uniref:rubredoxin n=1 Tax=Paraglaciecola arctica TaxID=1128911 RepID=UPI001C06D43C|nr:rubredoxin [Paraglaciecola arctica]MBU3002486.1 rubredoxin [Paraglaciecola arctica]
MGQVKNSNKVWHCDACGFTYSEKLGLPDEGIPAGTAWEDVPEDWYCPDCGVGKDDFTLMDESDL